MKLYKYNSTYWIESDSGAFECLTKGYAKRALKIHGVPQEEVDIAFEELSDKSHTCAHFGIDNYFLFTDNALQMESMAA